MNNEKNYLTEDELEALREAVKPYYTEKRLSHTLGVEREAESLGRIFLPEDVTRLRAAALLHDITKNLPTEKQLKICEEFGIITEDADIAAPKLFHAKTGSLLAERDFSGYTDGEIISAVRWHTTGRADMSLFDMLIYLADYIEDTRTFPDCIALRKMFYEGIEGAKTEKERFEVLRKTMIRSFDMTIRCLIEEGGLVDRDTVEARNRFILKEIKTN